MTLLSEALNEYVAMRRNLGFVFRVPASLLRTFVAFVDQAGSPFITTELARQWALQPTGAQPSTGAGRLAIARRFAVWRRASDLRTEVPPVDAVGQRYRRRPPRFYRDQDVVHLMQNAAALSSAKKLRGRTYATLFGLLAITGLRINEALHLDRSDVDLETGVLLIRRTKFGKSRLVPIHPTTQAALRAYSEARDRIIPKPATPAFDVSRARPYGGHVLVPRSRPGVAATRGGAPDAASRGGRAMIAASFQSL